MTARVDLLYVVRTSESWTKFVSGLALLDEKLKLHEKLFHASFFVVAPIKSKTMDHP